MENHHFQWVNPRTFNGHGFKFANRSSHDQRLRLASASQAARRLLATEGDRLHLVHLAGLLGCATSLEDSNNPIIV